MLKKRDNNTNFDSNGNLNPFSQPPTRGTHFLNNNEDFGYDPEHPVDI